MRRIGTTRLVGLTVFAISLSAVAAVIIPNLQHFRDATGAVATFNTAGNGNINEKNAFFQNQGTNGRSCLSCHHQPAQAFSITPAAVQEVQSPDAWSGSPLRGSRWRKLPHWQGKRRRRSQFVVAERFLIPGRHLCTRPQFTIEAVHDPYHCAITFDKTTGTPIVSVYRRPAAHLKFEVISAV